MAPQKAAKSSKVNLQFKGLPMETDLKRENS